MTPELTIFIRIITAIIGATLTIAIILWKSGKFMGEIKSQIEQLQDSVSRQNGNTAAAIEKIERNTLLKVEKTDCQDAHSELNKTIITIHGRIDDLYTQRQESDERILTAIKKRRTVYPRKVGGK